MSAQQETFSPRRATSPGVDASAEPRFRPQAGPAWATHRLIRAGLARWRLWLALTLLVALVGPGIEPWHEVIAGFLGRRSPDWVAEDFRAFYAAGRMVASGHGHLLYNTAAIGAVEGAGRSSGSHALAYFNPPFFALFCAPFAALSFDQAFQAWTIISLLLLGLSLSILWRIAAPLGRCWRVVLLAGLAALYPTTYGLRLGQFSLLLTVAWAGAYWFLRRGRPRAAGLSLLLLLVKPELLVPPLLFLVWKRRSGVLVTLLPAAACLVILSVAIVGPRGALAYPGFLLHSTTWQSNGVASQLMFGWNGVLADSSGRLAPAALGLATLLGFAGLAGAAFVWRGPLRVDSGRFAGQWLMLTLATLLADPHLYLQDTIIAIPAVVACIACSHGSGRAAIAAAAVAAGALLQLGLYPNQNLHLDLVALAMGLTVLVWPLAILARVALPFPPRAWANRGIQASGPSTSSSQSA